MKRNSNIMFAGKNTLFSLVATFGLISVTTAATTPDTNSPSTFVGPYVHGSFTNDIKPGSAYSIGGEYGPRNYRLDGTLAWEDVSNQRLKISAEWLMQNINYAFFSGNSTQWVNQTGIGGSYRYFFDDRYFDPEFTLDAYFDHSSTKRMRTTSGTFIKSGVTTPYVNVKRIAGANAAGVAPGVVLALWPNGKLGAALNYDNVTYDTAYVSNKDAKGFGSTFYARQAFTDIISMDGTMEFLQPYNNYSARINFANLEYYGIWGLGIEGTYTIGKNTMPDTYNVGFSVDYQLERQYITSISARAARESFLSWVSRASERKPQVLGVADQSY